MKSKRLIVTVIVVLVFGLMLATVAMAAPETAVEIAGRWVPGAGLEGVSPGFGLDGQLSNI